MSHKKTGPKLAAARKKARKAAQGQLTAIEGNLSNKLGAQKGKLARQNERDLRLIRNQVQSANEFGNRQIRGAENTAQQIRRSGSATGAASMPGDMAITQTRRSAAARDKSYAVDTAKTGKQLGKSTAKVGERSVMRSQKINASAGRVSNTILDVLESERAMVDERFLAEIREKHADRRFQMKVMEKQQEMAKEMAVFENNLPLGTADRQAMRLQWKYDKKKMIYENGLLEKSTKDNTWSTMQPALSTASEVEAAAINAYGSDAFQAQVDKAMKSDDFIGTRGDALRSLIQARVQNLAGNALTPEAVSRIVHKVVASGGQSVGNDGLLDTVVGMDESGKFAEFVANNEQRVQRYVTQDRGVSQSSPEDMSAVEQIMTPPPAQPEGQASAQMLSPQDSVNAFGAAATDTDNFVDVLSNYNSLDPADKAKLSMRMGRLLKPGL